MWYTFTTIKRTNRTSSPSALLELFKRTSTKRIAHHTTVTPPTSQAQLCLCRQIKTGTRQIYIDPVFPSTAFSFQSWCFSLWSTYRPHHVLLTSIGIMSTSSIHFQFQLSNKHKRSEVYWSAYLKTNFLSGSNTTLLNPSSLRSHHKCMFQISFNLISAHPFRTNIPLLQVPVLSLTSLRLSYLIFILLFLLPPLQAIQSRALLSCFKPYTHRRSALGQFTSKKDVKVQGFHFCNLSMLNVLGSCSTTRECMDSYINRLVIVSL